MKKLMLVAAVVVTFATQAFASYWVVTKDGSRYEARAKWTMQNGKALITLRNGNIMSLDPATIDVAKSEETTRLGGGQVFGVEQAPVAAAGKASTLGSAIHLRKIASGAPQEAAPAPAAPSTTTEPPAVAAPAGTGLGSEVTEKFERAFENVGIFEHKVIATGPHSLRADLTADSEDKVFNTLSATAFLIVRNAGVTGVQIDAVDLFMKTTTGGASGRFHLTREDAQALEAKTITREEFFVRKVLF
jgi:outer membrane lipoprotein SlyB